MAKHRDILGNEREIEDKTITISLEKYNTLIIKEAIADGLIQTKTRRRNWFKIQMNYWKCIMILLKTLKSLKNISS